MIRLVVILLTLVSLSSGSILHWAGTEVASLGKLDGDGSALSALSAPLDLALTKEADSRVKAPLRMEFIGGELTRPRSTVRGPDAFHAAALEWVRATCCSLLSARVRLQI